MKSENSIPLAHALRPVDLNSYVGQTHLLSKGAPLRQICETKHLCSMVLYGPPGCGKTSLINLLEHYWQTNIVRMSAVNCSVKDIKDLVSRKNKKKQDHQKTETPQYQANSLFDDEVQLPNQDMQSNVLTSEEMVDDKNNTSMSGGAAYMPDPQFDSRLVVFMDEIHRFNKSQQDAFLPYVESGEIVLLGATTENPAFSINKALLSRVRIFKLQCLKEADLQEVLLKALKYLSFHKGFAVAISKEAEQALINAACGDARKLLTQLELASVMLNDTNTKVSTELLASGGGEEISSFDKSGDDYYVLLSAFHKSVRGSDTNAALFWFARLLQSSVDIVPIARRLLAIATEDIGNADPRAMQVCLNAWDIYHRVGSAEGERAIAQAIIYCALAPKSNAVYCAFKEAKKLAKLYANAPVPTHLKNSVQAKEVLKREGLSGYQYSHDFEFGISPGQVYLPEEVPNTPMYRPVNRGLERQLSEKAEFIDKVNTSKNN